MELGKVKETAFVWVNFMEYYFRIFFPIFEYSHNFINFSGKNISSFPKINVENFLLKNFPLDPAWFVGVNIVEDCADFMSSDLGVNFPDYFFKSIETYTLPLVGP